MNHDEWKLFSAELFTAFPGFRDYINAKSDNPAGTLSTWQTTLADVAYTEAKSVLTEWLNGTSEPPKAYDRDYIAIVIRSRVGFKRDQLNRFSKARSIYDEKQRVIEERKAYQPLSMDLQDALELAIVTFQRVESGEISMQEYNKICWEAVA